MSLSDRESRTSKKPYDYLLKFLLVGDSDVGKQEIVSHSFTDGNNDVNFLFKKTE